MMTRIFSGLAASMVLGLAASGSAQTPAPPAEPDRWTIVHCGTLLAVPGQAPKREQTVVIKNDRIESVRDGYVNPESAGAPAGATPVIIDLKDRYVLPGLIDCHVHLTFETSPEGRLRTVTESEADAAIDGVVFARRTLEAGFTTVRDVGSRGDACFALRDAINDGRILGPRILASGQSITPTGGHADRTNSYREDVFGIPGPIQGVADGADACRQAVRNQVKRGADCIKLTATGGVLSNIGAGLEQQFFEDELKAIVETAHLLKMKVAAHAHGKNGIDAALRAGVDSIEHGTFLDDESIALFKQRGAYYVPTITAGKAVEEYSNVPGYYIPAVIAKARTVGPKIQNAFGRAYKAGVKIAFGSDAGVFPHGQNGREFAYMVEAGMPAMEAIKSATIDAADLCGLSADVGTIEAGKTADLVGVRSDPARDISELQRVAFVLRAGKIAKNER